MVNVYNLQVATYGLDALRMRAVDFNAPGIVGYFIVANEIKVQSIIPHIHGHETDIIPHRNDGIYSESTWTYMPMDEGEYITGIYRRVIQSQNHLHNVGFIVSDDIPPSYSLSTDDLKSVYYQSRTNHTGWGLRDTSYQK